MKFNLFTSLKKSRQEATLVVLLATSQPNSEVLESLARLGDIQVRESFTTRGVLQRLPGAHLVILDEVLITPEVSREILDRTLEMSGIPVVSSGPFLSDAGEWIGRARLTSTRKITFLPPRQVNLVNWSGGVGKTTLAMAICRRFVARTGLPAALLELSMGGSALHARISRDLPEFFAIATHKEDAGLWVASVFIRWMVAPLTYCGAKTRKECGRSWPRSAGNILYSWWIVSRVTRSSMKCLNRRLGWSTWW